MEEMKTDCVGSLLQCFMLMLSLLSGITTMPVSEVFSLCTAPSTAKYRLTFTGKWSQTAFPKQYPVYRPPAQWSPLIGVTHSTDYHIWQKNEYATNGVREFSEKGEAWTLIKEVETAGERIQSVYGLFSSPAVLGGTGQTSTEFEVYARHNFLSFIMRLVPSPDWFVGIDSLNLCEGDRWKENISLDLYPYDAGTDSGFTFSSPKFETIPQDKVTEITSSFPSHPANSFFYPRLKHLPPIAKVTLTKIKNKQIFTLPIEPTQSIQIPNGNEIDESLIKNPHFLLCENGGSTNFHYFQIFPCGSRVELLKPTNWAQCGKDKDGNLYCFTLYTTTNTKKETFEKIIETYTPLDCEVSAWSPWGLCKGQCGEEKGKGVRYRTRYIHIHPANNGAACPSLEEEKACVPDNCK